MKIFFGFVILLAVAISAMAQDAKVIAEIAASSEKVVKNSPFSADAVSESVQMLADGNRIVRSTTSKLYRNGEGRFRREILNGSGGMLGSVYSYGSGITILDPIGGHSYLLNSELKVARQALLKPLTELRIRDSSGSNQEQRAVVLEKLKGEIRATTGNAIVSVGGGQGIGTTVSAIGGTLYGAGTNSKYETRTEQLGAQNIEGVEAEGTRTTTTIPAGAIGNERAIDIVYERWYSKELQLVVMSKHADPRFGEQTYRLTNINRSEPDPSLFSLPTGYRVITEPSGSYRVTSAAKIEAEKAAVKTAQREVTVTRTRP